MRQTYILVLLLAVVYLVTQILPPILKQIEHGQQLRG